MDYVKIMKYGNIINLTFNIEQDKPFDIGEKMNEICADAYMNGYNWEAFFNYYLGKNGAMLTNAITPDGYYVGSDGAWIPDTLNLSGFRGEVLLYMHSADKYTKVTGNTWNVLGEWSRLDVDAGYTFFSTQDLTVNEHTKYFTVEEGTAAEIPISRESFERFLTDRSLEYEGFKLELNNKTVTKAYVYQ